MLNHMHERVIVGDGSSLIISHVVHAFLKLSNGHPFDAVSQHLPFLNLQINLFITLVINAILLNLHVYLLKRALLVVQCLYILFILIFGVHPWLLLVLVFVNLFHSLMIIAFSIGFTL